VLLKQASTYIPVFPIDGAITTERTYGAYSIAMDFEMAMIAAFVAQSAGLSGGAGHSWNANTHNTRFWASGGGRQPKRCG
jgi:hypothetical protein